MKLFEKRPDLAASFARLMTKHQDNAKLRDLNDLYASGKVDEFFKKAEGFLAFASRDPNMAKEPEFQDFKAACEYGAKQLKK